MSARTTHFYGDGCPEHNRCQDFNTEPGVHYHAHDLPVCTDDGVRFVKDRWCCERHAHQRETSEKTATPGTPIAENHREPCHRAHPGVRHGEWERRRRQQP